MAIEIIPKKEAKAPWWEDIAFYLVIILLIGGVLGYFGMGFYQNRLQEKMDQLEASLVEKKTGEMRTLEKRVLEDKRKIDNFASLLEEHKKGSGFFEFLKGVCHPRVFYSGVNLDVETGTVNLGGTAESFQALGQQISILKRQGLISNVYLSGLSLGKQGTIGFSLSFSISPQMFK